MLGGKSIQTATPRYENRDGYFLAAPWLVGAVLLTLASLGFSFGISFTRWDGAGCDGAAWVGSGNYAALLSVDPSHPVADDDPWYWSLLGGKPADPEFVKSLYNSMVYSLMAVPLGIAVALVLAVLLNTAIRGIGFFRGLYYLPHVLGGVATVLVWSWIFNPRFGPLNALLENTYEVLDPIVRAFGGSGTADWPLPGWLMSPGWCKPAVAIMQAWTAGGAVFIFLAALQGVDPATTEAARIDGAGAWRRFRSVTLPQLTPAILFNLVTGSVGAMQAFNSAYLLYNRAQDDGLLFYMLQLYRVAFEPPYRLGYASAMAWILFALLLVLALTAVATSRKWVHYAD